MFNWLTPEDFYQYGQYTPKGGGGVNPYMMGGAMGLQSLMSLFQPKTAVEKTQEWKLGQLPGLYNQFRGEYNRGGDVIDPAKMAQLMALFRQHMGGTQNRIAGAAGRFSGMRSPETYGMISRNIGEQEAGYAGNLGMANVQMTQQKLENLRRLMAGLVG